MSFIEEFKSLCVICVVLGGPCFLYAEFARWYLEHWVQTEGEIVEANVDSGSSGTFARIAFAEKATAHRTARIFTFIDSCVAKQGDKVPVMFNPKNPSEAATTSKHYEVFHVFVPRVCGCILPAILLLMLGLGMLERWTETRTQMNPISTHP